jgi:hypothetical protein
MNEECSICFEIMDNKDNNHITTCNHAFHTFCIKRCGKYCPLCRGNITDKLKYNYLYYLDEKEYNFIILQLKKNKNIKINEETPTYIWYFIDILLGKSISEECKLKFQKK